MHVIMHAISSLLLALTTLSNAQPMTLKRSKHDDEDQTLPSARARTASHSSPYYSSTLSFQNPYQIGLQLYKDWQCQHASTLIDLRDGMTHAALSSSSSSPYAFCYDLSGAPYTGVSPGAFRMTGLAAGRQALEGSMGFYAERGCGGTQLERWKYVEGLGYVRDEGTGEIAFGVAGKEVVDPCHPYDRLHMGRALSVLVTVWEVEGKGEDLRERLIEEEPFCDAPFGKEGTCAGRADIDDPFPVIDGAERG